MIQPALRSRKQASESAHEKKKQYTDTSEDLFEVCEWSRRVEQGGEERLVVIISATTEKWCRLCELSGTFALCLGISSHTLIGRWARLRHDDLR